MGKFEEIINNGKKNGKSIEEINKELKEAGANFHLNSNGTKSGWTEQEIVEGFNKPEKEPEEVKHLHDYMKYNKNLAGCSKIVILTEGVYEIFWDENGNPEKAIRKN